MFARRLLCSRVLPLRPPLPPCQVFRHYAVIPTPPIVRRNMIPPEIEPPSALKTHPTHLQELSSKLRFPLKHSTAEITPEEYTPPLGGTETLPFHFTRTSSNKLPIYTDFKVKGHKKEYTVVRKFSGNIKELSQELSLLIPGAVIEERAASLVINGQHANLIRHWLKQLGF